jgi:hypothetical protein
LSVSSPFKIGNFLSLAQPGKVLCLLDGIYQGDSSMIAPSRNLSGVAGNPITIRALNDGGPTIDGQFGRGPVKFFGNSHWVLEGFNAKNSDGPVILIHPSVDFDSSHGSRNNIFRRVVAWDAHIAKNNSAVSIYSSPNNLFEDFAVFGTGRIMFGNFGPGSGGNVCRRCWVRWEGSTTVGPKMTYDLDYGGWSGTGVACENCLGNWSAESMPQAYDTTDINGNVIPAGQANSGHYVNFRPENVQGILRAQVGATPDENSCTQSSFLGSLAYLKSTDASSGDNYPAIMVFLGSGWGTVNCFKVRDTIAIVSPSHRNFSSTSNGNGGIVGFALNNKNMGTGDSAYNVTSVSALNVFGNWDVQGVSTGRSPQTVASPWTATGAGANLCYRYVNNLKTSTPLWPWPMNDRIKAATASAGAYQGPCPSCIGGRFTRTATDVTAEVESLIGSPIPSHCKNGTMPEPAPTPMPTPSGSIALSAVEVSPGATFSVTVSGGPGNIEEWVALYLASAPDSAYSYQGNWTYLNGLQTPPLSPLPSETTLKFTAPMDPGSYNLRYFAYNGYEMRLAVSANLKVVASAPTPTIDATAPVVTITSPVNNSVIQRKTIVALSSQ